MIQVPGSEGRFGAARGANDHATSTAVITIQADIIKQAVFSRPSAIWTSAMRDIANGTLVTHLLVSGQEYLFGLALSVVVAIPLGLLIGMFWRVNYLLDPWLSAIYATPSVALVPLIILLFGIGLESKIVVVFLEAFILITVATITGVMSLRVRPAVA